MKQYKFKIDQYEKIKILLRQRLVQNKENQKATRSEIRKLGFKISDHFNNFSDKDFEKLFKDGYIEIVDDESSNTEITTQTNRTKAQKNNSGLMKISLPPIIDHNTEILILGTMPGEISLEHQEYYKNPNNQFWPIVTKLLKPDNLFTAYNDKIELLKANKIGLWDVLHTCERKGSLDSKIKNAIANDFSNLFDKYKNVNTVIFNGKDSQEYFKNLVHLERQIKYYQFNSTSKLNTHKTIEEKSLEWGLVIKNAT